MGAPRVNRSGAATPPTAAARETALKTAHLNAFSVDVEDYFQVEAFKGSVDRESWSERPSRIVESTGRVLGLLDEAGVRATFFVLGWVAERYPDLVRRIHERGHEIASHGHDHVRANVQSPKEFRSDVKRARAVLEDCAGVRVRGFRAPTFSIGKDNWWTYDVLIEEGYEYSSSVYPITHDLYGMPGAPRGPFAPVPSANFLEIPIATVRLAGRNRPCGGGGYFRLLPYPFSRWCINRANKSDGLSCVFYCHPWEFDPAQPRISGTSLKSRFRHYINIGAMESRIARLLTDFSWGRIDEIHLGKELAHRNGDGR